MPLLRWLVWRAADVICAQHVAEGNDLEALMRMKADNSLLLGSIANAEQHQLSTTITPAKTSPSR
jgi:hypothetical protein